MTYKILISGTEYTKNIDLDDRNLSNLDNYQPFEKAVSKVCNRKIWIGDIPLIFDTKKEAENIVKIYKSSYKNKNKLEIVRAD